MIKLVSPEYSFPRFCEQMLGNQPLEVLSSASAEITYARSNHRENTKDKNFRKGSKGQVYCNDLQHFIWAFVNGAAPDNVSQEFLDAAKPLCLDLLRRVKACGLEDIVRRSSANIQVER